MVRLRLSVIGSVLLVTFCIAIYSYCLRLGARGDYFWQPQTGIFDHHLTHAARRQALTSRLAGCIVISRQTDSNL